MENALLAKVDNAIAKVADGKIKTAINNLNAFKNQVEAQAGKKISADDAQDLLDCVAAVIADL